MTVWDKKSFKLFLDYNISMLDINSLEFRPFVEGGIPLERLTKRLQPLFGLSDDQEEIEAHDGFADFSLAGFIGMNENVLELIHGRPSGHMRRKYSGERPHTHKHSRALDMA